MVALKILNWIENQMYNYFMEHKDSGHGNSNSSYNYAIANKFDSKCKIPQCKWCFFKANIENIRLNILFTMNKREQANISKERIPAGEFMHFGSEYFLTKMAINFANGKYQCNQSYCIENINVLCDKEKKIEILLVYWTNILWHVRDWLVNLCLAKRYYKALNICKVLLQHWFDMSNVIISNDININIMKKIETIDKENHHVLSYVLNFMTDVSLLTNNFPLFENIEYLLKNEWNWFKKSNDKNAMQYEKPFKVVADRRMEHAWSSFDTMVNKMFSEHFTINNIDEPWALNAQRYVIAQA